jgi:hypothetical protein
MTNLIHTTKLVRVLISVVSVVAVGALAFTACGDDDDNGGTVDARPSTADAAAGGGADARPSDAGAGTTFNVTLAPAQEVPTCANAGATATGSAVVTVSADNSMIVVSNLTYMNLSGPATLGHIHSGASGAMGPAVLNFGTGAALTSPINKTFTSADYTAATGAPADFAAFVTALKAGQAYLNIHTGMCGSGEIRGQIQ